MAITDTELALHGYYFKVVATDGGPLPASAQWPETTVLVPVGSTRDIEFVADAPGDWAMHCHMTHHVMNQMGHELPNLIGVKPGELDRRAGRVAPGYMTMGQDGMGEMGTMGMKVPTNSIPVAAAREQLNRLMGLWGEDTGWTLAAGAAELPEDGDLSALEQRGVRERLDVSAARFDVDAVEYALKLRRRGLIPNVDVGVEGRNEVGDDVGHEWVVGPSLQIELPLFDPGHADLARLRAQLRQAQHLYQDAAIVARSQIREGRAALVAARRRAEYMRASVLPRHEQIYEQTLAEYNGMQVGAYELFSARSEQVHAQQEHAAAQRDYWIARAQPEYWVGGRLPASPRHRDQRSTE